MPTRPSKSIRVFFSDRVFFFDTGNCCVSSLWVYSPLSLSLLAKSHHPSFSPTVDAHSSPLPPAPPTSLRLSSSPVPPAAPPPRAGDGAAETTSRRRAHDRRASQRRAHTLPSPLTPRVLGRRLAITASLGVASRRTTAASAATLRRRALGSTAARRHGGGDGATPATPRLRSPLGSPPLGRRSVWRCGAGA